MVVLCTQELDSRTYFGHQGMEVRPTDLICVTVLDLMKHGHRLFRFGKIAELARYAFFIADITAMMTIVVTRRAYCRHS